MMPSGRRIAFALATALAACSGADRAPKIPLGQSRPVPGQSLSTSSAPGPATPAAAAINASARPALDSGNALFRNKNFPGALAQYRLAAERAPEHAAPLFGIYMVAQATGNARLADSALAGIQSRTGDDPASPRGARDAVSNPHPVTKK